MAEDLVNKTRGKLREQLNRFVFKDCFCIHVKFVIKSYHYLRLLMLLALLRHYCHLSRSPTSLGCLHFERELNIINSYKENRILTT